MWATRLLVMSHDQTLRGLHDSLDRRWRPEEAAEAVSSLLDGALSKDERRALDRATRGSLRKTWEWSSMSADFARPVDMRRQLHRARVLFPTVGAPDDASAGDAVAMLGFL